MAQRRVARSLFGAQALFALALIPAATAVADQPLTITSFAVQTTKAVQQVGGGGPDGYVNEPSSFTQAAGYPEAVTARVEVASEELVGREVPTRDLRDIVIGMPPGLTANPSAVERCPLREVLANRLCPIGSQIGVFTMRAAGQEMFGPIVDVVPERGAAAELALETPSHLSLLMTGVLVRDAGGYRLALVGDGILSFEVVAVEASLWGVPAAAAHDPQRGLLCTKSGGSWNCEGGDRGSGEPVKPFIAMPSDCTDGPLTATLEADSWEEPASWVRATTTMPAPTGCNLPVFHSTLEVGPETSLADEPTGMTMQLKTPQAQSYQAGTASVAETRATPPLRKATITLPQGVSINPPAAAAAQPCVASGPEGIDIPTGAGSAGALLIPGEAGEGEEVGLEGLKRLAPGHCPAASRLGTAEASMPLLIGRLKGSVYLASSLCGEARQEPCNEADAADGRLLRFYLELTSGGEPGPEGITPPVTQSGAGLVVKLAGYIELNPQTGQLTVKIPEAPELPIEDLTISLNGGPQALLANPATCGSALVTSDLAPWSVPGITPEGAYVPGTPDVTPSTFFEVTGCQSSPQLRPGFLAGTLTPVAGTSSPLTITVTRNDREPYLRALQVKLPPGLSARLSGAALCSDAAASAGACPPASRIGSAIVGAGAGSHLLQLEGSIFLTGPYGSPTNPAPFGIAIVIDGRTGPVDLGTIVVRARVDIDPRTSQVTISSDSLPQIVLGVPLRLRQISLDIDRPAFIVNPTDCDAMSVTGTVEGLAASGGDFEAGSGPAAAEGSGSASAIVAAVSDPFAAAACNRLRFRPAIAASTGGNGRLEGHGASLDLHLRQRGGQANLQSVRIVLPKRLSARGRTLRHACSEGVFNANPAACPKASLVGYARVRTPLLKAPLLGPAYLVATEAARGRHTGFPNLALVLQGEGIHIELTGHLYLSARNVTSATFSSIPDIPIRRLDLVLPEGQHSILSAGGRLCGRRLRIMSAIVGQNGANRKTVAKLKVKGCRGLGRGKKGRGGRRRLRQGRHG